MAAPTLPYGVSDYPIIRAENMVYVDKTHMIPKFEEAGRFLFFLRLRRLGKSLLANLLWRYYDILNAEDHQNLFSGTWIGDHPTKEKNSYLVLNSQTWLLAT